MPAAVPFPADSAVLAASGAVPFPHPAGPDGGYGPGGGRRLPPSFHGGSGPHFMASSPVPASSPFDASSPSPSVMMGNPYFYPHGHGHSHGGVPLMPPPHGGMPMSSPAGQQPGPAMPFGESSRAVAGVM
jgi:hypothetical protein